MPVAELLEVVDAGNRAAVNVDLRRKTSHYCEGCASVWRGFRHVASAVHLKGAPVDHYHLAVQIGEGAEPEITVFQNRADAHLSVIDSCDQGARGRDLEQRMRRCAEILGQGSRDDG